jgi:hypothetical protein
MKEEQEWVSARVEGNDRKIRHVTAPRLTELKKAAEAYGASDEFNNHVDCEEFLWERLQVKVQAIDADRSFQDDMDGPAEYKRNYAKYLLRRDLEQFIAEEREALIAQWS